MKIDWFKALICLCAGLLAGYGFYTLSNHFVETEVSSVSVPAEKAEAVEENTAAPAEAAAVPETEAAAPAETKTVEPEVPAVVKEAVSFCMNRLVFSIIAGFMIFFTLGGALALKSKDEKGSVGNLKAVSSLMFIVSLITNIVFAFGSYANMSLMIIINGIEFLLYVTMLHGIAKALK